VWISEKNSRRAANAAGSLGTVTIGGEKVSILSEAECRNVDVYAPGGYCWRPAAGTDMLVIKCQDGQMVATGAEMPPDVKGMLPGEVYIKSDAGASIYLKNDGRIMLGGKVYIDGSLYLNGNALG